MPLTCGSWVRRDPAGCRQSRQIAVRSSHRRPRRSRPWATPKAPLLPGEGRRGARVWRRVVRRREKRETGPGDLTSQVTAGLLWRITPVCSRHFGKESRSRPLDVLKRSREPSAAQRREDWAVSRDDAQREVRWAVDASWTRQAFAQKAQFDPGTLSDFLEGPRLPQGPNRARIERALGWPSGADGKSPSQVLPGGETAEVIYRQPPGLSARDRERARRLARASLDDFLESLDEDRARG